LRCHFANNRAYKKKKRGRFVLEEIGYDTWVMMSARMEAKRGMPDR
jgi:hypothetical protein